MFIVHILKIKCAEFIKHVFIEQSLKSTIVFIKNFCSKCLIQLIKYSRFDIVIMKDTFWFNILCWFWNNVGLLIPSPLNAILDHDLYVSYRRHTGRLYWLANPVMCYIFVLHIQYNFLIAYFIRNWFFIGLFTFFKTKNNK